MLLVLVLVLVLSLVCTCRRRDPPDSLAFHPVWSLVSSLQPGLPAAGLAAVQVRGTNWYTAGQKVIF